MLKFLPIIVFSIAQKSHLAYAHIILNMPANFIILKEQIALLELFTFRYTYY